MNRGIIVGISGIVVSALVAAVVVPRVTNGMTANQHRNAAIDAAIRALEDRVRAEIDKARPSCAKDHAELKRDLQDRMDIVSGALDKRFDDWIRSVDSLQKTIESYMQNSPAPKGRRSSN